MYLSLLPLSQKYHLKTQFQAQKKNFFFQVLLATTRFSSVLHLRGSLKFIFSPQCKYMDFIHLKSSLNFLFKNTIKCKKWRKVTCFWLVSHSERRKTSTCSTLYPLKSEYIFSILLLTHYLKCWQGEFVYQSRALFLGDHFLYSRVLNVWFRGDILSSVSYRRVYIIQLKKSRFVENLLLYPKSEMIAFPKLKCDEIESAMFMFTLSLTR